MSLEFDELIRSYRNPVARWIAGLLGFLLGLSGLVVPFYFYFRYPIILALDHSGFHYPQKNLSVLWNQVKTFEPTRISNWLVQTKMIHVRLSEALEPSGETDFFINMPFASDEDFEQAVKFFERKVNEG